jgi:molecular chaperone HscB
MNLASTDFELFGIPQQFAQDRAALDARWKELQREAHPDKFAAQGSAAQRVAMQWSVRINEAYQRLKDPIRRAAYLCELHGVNIDAERNTAMPTDFLMQQISLREALEEMSDIKGLDDLRTDAHELFVLSQSMVEVLIDQKKDFSSAAVSVRSMMFMEKFLAEIDRRYEEFDNKST